VRLRSDLLPRGPDPEPRDVRVRVLGLPGRLRPARGLPRRAVPAEVLGHQRRRRPQRDVRRLQRRERRLYRLLLQHLRHDLPVQFGLRLLLGRLPVRRHHVRRHGSL
ncbi:MAG: hypothetical protein AVDCRST_MAG73-3665, partial [uncultured Thermomicrobiales bacterium]